MTRDRTLRQAVHPHVCGEIGAVPAVLAAIRRFTPTCVGKSERALELPRRRSRFTPTCVGKSLQKSHNALRAILVTLT